MNFFLVSIISFTFSSAVNSLHQNFKNFIQTQYGDGDFRTILDLYHKNKTEGEETVQLDLCQRYSEMKVVLDPQLFTSIEGRVITSLNMNMALTLDGRTNFSIHAVMECAVMQDDKKVFEFFVLSLPEGAKEFVERQLTFIPVYVYADTEDWRLFAVKNVYDYHLLRITFRGNTRDNKRIIESLQDPEHTKMVTRTINSYTKSSVSQPQIQNWTLHYDNFILLFDDDGKVQIPVILVMKLKTTASIMEYKYFVIFRKNTDIRWPKDPFFYFSYPKEEFAYLIHYTGEMVDNMWAFSFDSIIDPTRCINEPPFIDTIGL